MRKYLEFKNYKYKQSLFKAIQFDGTMQMAQELIAEGFPMKIKILNYKWKLMYRHPQVKPYEVKKGSYVIKHSNGDTWVMSETAFKYFYELIED